VLLCGTFLSMYIYIRTLTDHRWSQFADNLHPLHIATSCDIVTLGGALFLSLVAKRQAMDTFDLEGRMYVLLLSVAAVVVVDMEFCEVKELSIRKNQTYS